MEEQPEEEDLLLEEWSEKSTLRFVGWGVSGGRVFEFVLRVARGDERPDFEFVGGEERFFRREE